MFTIAVFKGKAESKVGAQIALTHRLYVSRWWLNSRLHMLIRGKHRYKDCVVAIGYLDGVPITVATVEKTIMVFCRKRHRGRGYGNATVQAATCASPVRVMGKKGVAGSDYFWQKAKIQLVGNTR